MSAEQVSLATKKEIATSDVIVDAKVYRDDGGVVMLKPSRVWKGERKPYYEILNDGCGVFLPNSGEYVRVLLEKVDTFWMIVAPIMEDKGDSRKFDAMVDEYLENQRPRTFRSVGLPMPPLP